MDRWRRWAPPIGIAVSVVAVVVASIQAEWPAAIAFGVLGVFTVVGLLAQRHTPEASEDSVSVWAVVRLVWPALLLGAALLALGVGDMVKGFHSAGTVRNGHLTVGVMVLILGVILYTTLIYYGRRMITRSNAG